MRTNRYDLIIAYLCLVSGLTISAVAVWYSVAGLVSIFAAAAIPIIIMGVALEGSKLVATVWLKLNWDRAPRTIKTYLCIAIAILMLITSMGRFGYLSKAHLDQNLVSGEVVDKVALIDEKIKTQRDNITAARAALQQMDNQVNERLSRSNDDKGAERAVQIRRQQQTERARLQKEISDAQSVISKLNEERAPIAKDLRAVEAEVGPIKYIAKLIYGDNPDANILEKAVTWVIIIIVIVFDPLAVVLLLASQYSFQWLRQEKEKLPEEEKQETIDEEPIEEQEAISEEPKPEPFIPPATAFWPFPIIGKSPEPEPEVKEDDFKFLAEYEEITPKDESEIEDDESEIDNASDSHKEAMRSWKHDHPNDSLKRHRKLFEQGLIKELPWEKYLKAQADFGDDQAAEEAAKWAQEQLEKKQEEESKKKDDIMDGASRDGTDSKKMGEVGYLQNAEQSESTLWKRIQDAKK